MHFDDFLKKACPPLNLDWRKYRRRAARHRIQARIAELGLAGYMAYLEKLAGDPAEAAGLAERMRITVSRFYRDRPCWEELQSLVLPRLLQDLAPGETLHCWSAGCCGGEEPYTLALLWLAVCQKQRRGCAIDILASDIDTVSLERARRGIYRASSLREIPATLRDRYFRRTGDFWHLDAEVKSLVRFEVRDLMNDLLPPPQHLICCRYLVFTYFRGERRLAAAKRLHQAIRKQGALMIGGKESLGPAAEAFRPWPGAKKIFRPA